MTQAVRVKLESSAFQHRGRRHPGVSFTSDFIGSEFLLCRRLSRFRFVTLHSHVWHEADPFTSSCILQIYVNYYPIWMWPPAAKVLSLSTLIVGKQWSRNSWNIQNQLSNFYSFMFYSDRIAHTRTHLLSFWSSWNEIVTHHESGLWATSRTSFDKLLLLSY